MAKMPSGPSLLICRKRKRQSYELSFNSEVMALVREQGGEGPRAEETKDRLPRSQVQDHDHPMSGFHGEHVVELMPGFPIFRLEEASLEGLNRLLSLEGDIFGDEAVGEWYMVSHIHHGNVMLVVDRVKKRSAGLAILMRDWDELDKCYLADFGIREDYRGQGLGSAFLGKVLELIKEEGFRRMSLTVDTTNVPAIGLYQKFGFQIAEERRNLYGLGRDRYIMEFEVDLKESPDNITECGE